MTYVYELSTYAIYTNMSDKCIFIYVLGIMKNVLLMNDIPITSHIIHKNFTENIMTYLS